MVEYEANENTEIDFSKTARRIYNSDFECFKSNVCHFLKNNGDIDFLIKFLTDDVVTEFANHSLWRECLYCLAMIDYISNQNDVPLRTKYDRYRRLKFEKPLLPRSARLVSLILKNDDEIKEVYANAIPEFLKYNIIEGDVRNVVWNNKR